MTDEERYNPSKPATFKINPHQYDIHRVVQDYIGVLTLGTNTPPINGNAIFFTISPPANMKVDCYIIDVKTRTRVSKKIPYYKLTMRNQTKVIDRYFAQVYKPHCDSYIYVYEVNQSNNIHVHGLIMAENVLSKYDLLCFRDTINKHHATLAHVKNPKLYQHFNDIVYCNDLNHVCEYISKDLEDSMPQFGYMTSADSPISQAVTVIFE